MKPESLKSPASDYSAFKDKVNQSKNLLSIKSQKKETKRKTLLITTVCPDLRCTGYWQDIFETFYIICKDRKHSVLRLKSEEYENSEAH